METLGALIPEPGRLPRHGARSVRSGRRDHKRRYCEYGRCADDADNSVYSESLDRFVRVRAVQEFSASRAVSFVFMLKNAIIETPGWDGPDKGQTAEKLSFFSRIDDMALDAFDRYASCREKLYEVSVNEFKRRNRKVLERLGLSETAGDT